MNAIVPVNVAALRVSASDNNLLVSQFTGRTAVFDDLPWGDTTTASTGDTIYRPLQASGPPAQPLDIGIHLHWQLPDFFLTGKQRAGDAVVFPPAPNRWLVVRSVSVWDTVHNVYGPVAVKAFVVESDFVGQQQWVDKTGMKHPSVPVPLPTEPGDDQPFRFMGRSLNYEDWQPGSEQPSDFLPSYKGTNDQFLHLTALGFVGPGFAGYYPECTTVFGFWDHFMDLPTVGPVIKASAAVKFKATYQVVGWLDPGTPDPLAGLGAAVTTAYNAYLAHCKTQDVTPTQTAADTLAMILKRDYGWAIPGLDANTAPPTGVLLNGVVQEIIWDQLTNPGTTTFLAAPTGAVWQSTAALAVGNTTTEALSARLAADLGTPLPPNELGGYEHLLNALQTGLLQQLEAQPSKLIYLDEALHAKGFAADFAGWEWVLDQPTSPASRIPQAFRQNELPPDLASLLDSLNAAQQRYDKARLGLVTRRRQLFMDWFRYVAAADNTANPDPNVDLGTLSQFLQSGGPCELSAVQDAGTDAGVLLFQYDPDSGNVTSVALAPGSGGKAAAVATAYTALTAALAAHPGWTLQAHAAPKFFTPTDPVLLAEGPGLVPVQRNGTADVLPVRLASQVLTQLTVSAGTPFTIAAATVPGVPVVGTPDVQALVAEAFLMVPMLAPNVAAAPGVPAGTVFAAALSAAQGGLSPLEGGPGAGLFADIRATGYKPAANPTESFAGPPALTFTWSNATGTGWVTDAVGWQAQSTVSALAPGRLDPFLPVYLTWSVRWTPMLLGNGTEYTADNLTRFFGLVADAVDYTYSGPGTFASPTPITYSGSVALSTRAAFSLAAQIDNYLRDHGDDPAKAELLALRDEYAKRNFVSQALDGFSQGQTLTKVIPQLRVENLANPGGARDGITPAIDAAATADPNDDWYDESFNGAAPVFGGALGFGPLRAGFLEVVSLEVADVFGQRMRLTTGHNAMAPVVAGSLKPPPTDPTNAGKAFLPPRLLTPTRLWFRFLAATTLPAHRAAGVMARAQPETNTHAASSPIFGWVVPNHLDQGLFFYDANGRAVGSFVRQDTVRYVTRPGNLANPTSDLATDLIGANPHLAAVMTFIHTRPGGFLTDLMDTIQTSDTLIHPASSAQDLALAVLIGRPLALARCVLGFETSGGLLPISQADQSPTDPFPADVVAGRFDYEARQEASSAKVSGVQLPVRLGDLPNIDDGLVVFLPEDTNGGYGKVFSPAAPAAGGNGVERPTATTTQLTLNGPQATMTLLLDPRATLHATTGLLPVATLEIDPDQYHAALANIAVTFFTAPVLGGKAGLVLPTPTEAGYGWSWIQAGAAPAPLAGTAVNGNAVFGYSPQTLVEGWLDLVPTPPPPPTRTAEVLS